MIDLTPAPTPSVEEVRELLRLVYDPEVGVNIIDLGLVYGLDVDGKKVSIVMTLTTPACPLGDLIREEINDRMQELYHGVESVDVKIVWDPPWSPEAITPEGKRQLGWSE